MSMGIEMPGPSIQKFRSVSYYGDEKVNPFRALRRSFEINQTVAGRRAGVSRSLWAAWEYKNRPITAVQLGRLATGFALDKDDIYWILRWWWNASD